MDKRKDPPTSDGVLIKRQKPEESASPSNVVTIETKGASGALVQTVSQKAGLLSIGQLCKQRKLKGGISRTPPSVLTLCAKENTEGDDSRTELETHSTLRASLFSNALKIRVR